jgi:Ig-like domain from next to BRCA1 gene
VSVRERGLGAVPARAALLLVVGQALSCGHPPQGEVIDTLSYFLSDHPETALVGETYEAGHPNAPSHPLSQTIEGNASYYVKWHPNAYEYYAWDDDSIYLREDRSWTDAADGNRQKPQAFAPGLWMKRRMRVGEEIDMGANQIHLVYRADCRPGRALRLGYKTVLEARIPRFDAGGELGLQDVIVLRYDYSLRTGIPDRQRVNAYEKFYYSREWGWIQWEYYQDDDLQKNPPTLKKRFRCNRRAPHKLAPNLANTCNRAVVVEMAVDGRPMPARLSLVPGERRVLTVTLQNVGASSWRNEPDVQFRLGLLGDGPQEGRRVDLQPREEVPSGGRKKFAVPFAAPQEPGDYVFQWRMLVEGAEWFGEATPEARVSVAAPRGAGPARPGGPSS